MKKNLIYIFILLSVMACLDDKSNYDYKDLNEPIWNTETTFKKQMLFDFVPAPGLFYYSRIVHAAGR